MIMYIDLNKIKDSLIIDSEYDVSKDYYEKTDIKNLSKIKFQGKLYYDYNDTLKLEGTCKGVMTLSDSITLDDIEYPFNFEIDYEIDENNDEIQEYYEKSENSLDIIGILWQNIVLEVPMRITNSKLEDIKTSGEGWNLIDENKKEIDPRLAKLTELLDDSGKE